MTITNSSVEGIHSAESLLDYAANRIAGNSGSAPAEDEVSLSDAAVAMVQARIQVAASVSAMHTANQIEKALVDLVG